MSTVQDEELQREDEINKRAESRFNPASKELGDLETSTGKGYVDSGVDQLEAFANDPVNASRDTANEAEGRQGLYRQTKNLKKQVALSPGGIGGLIKKGGPIGLITGLLVVPVVAFMALLPLKLFGLVANMTEAAGAVPAYAVERRVEYLMTRAFSTWLIKKSSGSSITDTELANKAIFCKNASIACSLTMTRIGDYFDKKYDFNTIDGNKKIITPKGRDGLGQKARGWEIQTEITLDDGTVEKQVRTIESNREMKAEIKSDVKQRMAKKSIITRYIARKVLMKRYGITNWRGFEKSSNKLADKKARFKAGIIRNTLGRVSPRMSIYLACLSEGGAACEKLKDAISSDIDNSPQKEGESNEQYEKRKSKNEALEKATGIGTTVAEGEEASKLISKQLFTKLASGAGIAGILDMVFGAIGAVDDGALESIMYDIRSNTYVGYAFGDETGIIPNIEKNKAGDGDDPDLMPILAEQLEGVEQSPVWQAENGLQKGNEKGWSRICEKDGKPEKIVLQGQYVCPERQLAQSVTSWMDSPSGQVLGTAASTWNNSAGLVFDLVGGIAGFAMDKLGINKAISALFGDDIAKFVQWMLGLFFDVPAVGDEATGDQNYDSLSAATWISQNSMMENGVDEDGDLLGGGGNLLSNDDVAVIQAEQNKEDQEYFNSQSQVAKTFDVNLRGSLMNSFLAQIPMSTFTSALSISALPSVALSSTASIFTPHTSAATAVPNNPHNIPLYGYTPGDTALTAKPSDDRFSSTSCQVSAKSREDSYDLDRSKYPIPVYKKSDPCALEKMAVGSILQGMEVKDDPNSFKDLGTSGSNSATPDEESTDGSSVGQSGESQAFGAITFPLKGTKSTVLDRSIFKNGTTALSDHPYIAYDILAATGTEVVAFADGVVSYVSTDKCPGQFLTIWNEKAGLGVSYMHLSTHIPLGAKVKAGDYVGKVGTASQGCGTPHLHIDASTDKIRQPCSREKCAESVKNTFRSIGKDLFDTYQKLPN